MKVARKSLGGAISADAGPGAYAAGGVAAAAASRGGPISSLSMYQEQPSEELTLEDFEVLAFDRLKSGWPRHEPLAVCG